MMEKEEKEPVIKYEKMSDGALQVECTRYVGFFKKGEVTRLVIRPVPVNLGKYTLRDCSASWYSTDDTLMFDDDSGRMVNQNAISYIDFFADIDLNLLTQDPNYCKKVMLELVSSERVESYNEMGLEESPQTPCGKYIGGVKNIDGYGPQVLFSQDIGEIAHNSEEMIEKRNIIAERKKIIPASRLVNFVKRKGFGEKDLFLAVGIKFFGEEEDIENDAVREIVRYLNFYETTYHDGMLALSMIKGKVSDIKSAEQHIICAAKENSNNNDIVKD